jgi:hypothetical protein
MSEDKEELVKQNVDLYDSSNELINKIINENDRDKLNDLTNLFMINQKKKDIVRANKLSNLLNLIDNEVYERVSNEPEMFDNLTLLKYMDSTQQTINNVSQSINQVPFIQINNQKNEININSNSSGLDRDSRAKVLEVVTAILNGTNDNVIDVDVEEEDG